MAGFTWDFPVNLPFLDLDSAFLLSLSLCYPRYGWWSDPPPFCWSPTMWGCHNSTTDGYDTYDLYLIAFMGLKNTNKHNWTAPLPKKKSIVSRLVWTRISRKRDGIWHSMCQAQVIGLLLTTLKGPCSILRWSEIEN